jgi:CheY-like chemotaxis protein
MTRLPERYDLLLCDQCLPDMQGLDLIELAHKRGLLQRAILLSGLCDTQLRALEKKALKRRVPLLGCLSKPLHGPDLYRMLNTSPPHS